MARYSEIFDYNDNHLWSSCLPYQGLYLFVTAEAAQIALSYFSNLTLSTLINDPEYTVANSDNKVAYQLCYQCNNYQARYPTARALNGGILNSNMVSRSFAPNFYSDNLCRKINNSHEKKKKYSKAPKMSSSYEAINHPSTTVAPIPPPMVPIYLNNCSTSTCVRVDIPHYNNGENGSRNDQFQIFNGIIY